MAGKNKENLMLVCLSYRLITTKMNKKEFKE